MPFFSTCRIVKSGQIESTIIGIRYGLAESTYQQVTNAKPIARAGHVRSQSGRFWSVHWPGNKRIVEHKVAVPTAVANTSRSFPWTKSKSLSAWSNMTYEYD